MGVLMRVVDRCVVLDHGEVIFARACRRKSHATPGWSRSIWARMREVQATGRRDA